MSETIANHKPVTAQRKRPQRTLGLLKSCADDPVYARIYKMESSETIKTPKKLIAHSKITELKVAERGKSIEEIGVELLSIPTPTQYVSVFVLASLTQDIVTNDELSVSTVLPQGATLFPLNRSNVSYYVIHKNAYGDLLPESLLHYLLRSPEQTEQPITTESSSKPGFFSNIFNSLFGKSTSTNAEAGANNNEVEAIAIPEARTTAIANYNEVEAIAIPEARTTATANYNEVEAIAIPEARIASAAPPRMMLAKSSGRTTGSMRAQPMRISAASAQPAEDTTKSMQAVLESSMGIRLAAKKVSRKRRAQRKKHHSEAAETAAAAPETIADVQRERTSSDTEPLPISEPEPESESTLASVQPMEATEHSEAQKELAESQVMESPAAEPEATSVPEPIAMAVPDLCVAAPQWESAPEPMIMAQYQAVSDCRLAAAPRPTFEPIPANRDPNVLSTADIERAQSTVRRERSLHPSETEYVLQRKVEASKAIAKFIGMELTAETAPVIGLCGSTGAFRSAVSSLGFLQGNLLGFYSDDAIRLADISTYFSGASGSMWAYASLLAKIYKYEYRTESPLVPNDVLQLEHFNDEMRKRLTDLSINAKEALTAVWEVLKTASKQIGGASIGTVAGSVIGGAIAGPTGASIGKSIGEAITGGSDDSESESESESDSLDIALIYSMFLNRIFLDGDPISKDYKMSSIMSRATADKYPFPLFNAVTAVKPEEWCEWTEITPFEIGCPGAPAFIPTTVFGQQFQDGKLVDFERQLPEPHLAYLLALCGAAFSAPIMNLTEDLPAVLRDITNLFGSHQMNPAYVSNWMWGLDSENRALAQFFYEETIQFLDAGTAAGLPLFPLLRPERQTDVIIVFDVVDSTTKYGELRNTANYLQRILLLQPTDLRPLPKSIADLIAADEKEAEAAAAGGKRPTTTEFATNYVTVLGKESYPQSPLIVYVRGPFAASDADEDRDPFFRAFDLRLSQEKYDHLLGTMMSRVQREELTNALRDALKFVAEHKLNNTTK